MITLDLAQGSPEWLEARLRIPTASQFKRIITSKKLTYSASASDYVADLLAEWVSGYPVERGSSQAMDRGTGMELEGVAWYELQRDVETTPGGFVMRDDRKAGASPDRLVGDDGLLEMKCPMIHTHIGFLLNPSSLVEEYRAQVQGELYVTEREWGDLVSYHPTLPKVLQRVERDDEFQNALHVMLGRFLNELEEGRNKLIAMGVKPAPSFLRQADPAAWTGEYTGPSSPSELHRALSESVAVDPKQLPLL